MAIDNETVAREHSEPAMDAHVGSASSIKTILFHVNDDDSVMGGYSHSRAGEFMFGGVTRALLKDCPVALAMAH